MIEGFIFACLNGSDTIEGLWLGRGRVFSTPPIQGYVLIFWSTKFLVPEYIIKAVQLYILSIRAVRSNNWLWCVFFRDPASQLVPAPRSGSSSQSLRAPAPWFLSTPRRWHRAPNEDNCCFLLAFCACFPLFLSTHGNASTNFLFKLNVCLFPTKAKMSVFAPGCFYLSLSKSQPWPVY